MYRNILCRRLEDENLEAKVGAFPFTTIDSNIARATFSTPDPALVTAEDGPEIVRAANTKTQSLLGLGKPSGHRYHNIVLKDVAGLVPGAYSGRGRGNAFLNELCDADVLVHIVDAAGLCDEHGNGLQGQARRQRGNYTKDVKSVGDPLKDIS